MDGPTWIAAAVGVTVLLAFLWRLLKAAHRVANGYEDMGERIGSLERTLNNGISTKISSAEAKAAEACRLAGVAATTASRLEQQAHDNGRATAALRAEVDAFTRVAMSDVTEIWTTLARMGHDRRRAETEET